MKLRIDKVLFVFILTLGIPLFSDNRFQVFPTRVILSNNKRAAEVTIRNQNTTRERYKISAVFFRMNRDGSMVLVKYPKPEENSAVSFLHFSPKYVELGPNEEQLVRIMIRPLIHLTEGDYQAHLRFVPLNDNEEPEIFNNQKEKIMMHVKAKMAISISVIFRHGNAPFKLSLSNLELFKKGDHQYSFKVNMNRSGKGFAIGDFFVFFKPLNFNEDEKLVGAIKGVASYLDFRTATYDLNNPENIDIKNGILHLKFYSSSSEGEKLLAETTAKIP